MVTATATVATTATVILTVVVFTAKYHRLLKQLMIVIKLEKRFANDKSKTLNKVN